MKDEFKNNNDSDRARYLYADLRWPLSDSSFILHPSSFRVCRLGLATRGGSDLTVGDVQHALARGVNFLNWCGTPDALSQAIADLGPRRQEVLVCVQFE